MAIAIQTDFIDVRLSAAGLQMLPANGSLRITAAYLSYLFTPGAPVRVLTSEWAKILSREIWQGKPVFEVMPAPAPVSAAPVSGARTKQQAAKNEATAPESPIAQKEK